MEIHAGAGTGDVLGKEARVKAHILHGWINIARYKWAIVFGEV
jgi:hypothetical protein